VNVRVNVRVQINQEFVLLYRTSHSGTQAPDHLTMNLVSGHALLAVGHVRLGYIDGGYFILAATAFQEKETTIKSQIGSTGTSSRSAL